MRVLSIRLEDTLYVDLYQWEDGEQTAYLMRKGAGNWDVIDEWRTWDWE